MTFKGNIVRVSLVTLAIVLPVSISNAQTSSQEQVAAVVSSSAKASATAPVYTDYRGVSVGMTAEEVR